MRPTFDCLKPYIDKGQLVVSSGQTDFRTVATDGWKLENAQRRMTDILQKYYGGGKSLNVVIAANDDLAEGYIRAQQTADYSGTPTILTGQDATATGVNNIKAVVEGSQPAINDVTNIKNDVLRCLYG